jgi:hypothetical protein
MDSYMPRFSAGEEVLIALDAMPKGQATPIQAVKMLFLMEKKVPHAIGGTNFHFVPYDYGPFDQKVYSELEALGRKGLLDIVDGKPKLYRLTSKGRAEALRVRNRLDPALSSHLSELGIWISRLSFGQLVSAIYSAYPEMRANSIFHG